MARIKKLQNGSYQIRISNGSAVGKNGKRVQTIINFNYFPQATTPKAIEKEVSAYASQLEHDVQSGKYSFQISITFEEYYLLWKRTFQTILKPQTYATYCIAIDSHFIPVLGQHKLSKISPSDIESIILKMNDSGYAHATITKYLNALKSVFNDAYDKRIITFNPASKIKVPKVNVSKEIKCLTEYQTNLFLQALNLEYSFDYDQRQRMDQNGNSYCVKNYSITKQIPLIFRALFTLALYSGCRRAELLGLTWNDIDFKNNQITINKAIVNKNGTLVLDEPKNKYSKRTISIHQSCIELLSELMEEQYQSIEKLGTYWQGYPLNQFKNNFVFTQDNGNVMHLSTPTHKFKEIINLYNKYVDTQAQSPFTNGLQFEQDKHLPSDITLHALRHTHITLLLTQGVDVITVSKRAGHKDSKTTLNIYGHFMKAKDQEASKILGALLSPAEEKVPKN